MNTKCVKSFGSIVSKIISILVIAAFVIDPLIANDFNFSNESIKIRKLIQASLEDWNTFNQEYAGKGLKEYAEKLTGDKFPSNIDESELRPKISKAIDGKNLKWKEDIIALAQEICGRGSDSRPKCEISLQHDKIDNTFEVTPIFTNQEGRKIELVRNY